MVICIRGNQVKEDHDYVDACLLAFPTLQGVLLSAFVERNNLLVPARYSGRGGLWNELSGAEVTSFV